MIPTLASLFDVRVRDLSFDDLFVVKYDAEATGGQRSLAEHYDDTLLSFSVLLSDPAVFEGGGTRFPFCTWLPKAGASAIENSCHTHISTTDTLCPVHRGDLVAHCGRLVHEGVAVAAGQRYILVGFVAVAGSTAADDGDGALAEYLCGLGRATHAKRLGRRGPEAWRAHSAMRFRSSKRAQRAWRSQLEYTYASVALERGGDDDDAPLPPEFTTL